MTRIYAIRSGVYSDTSWGPVFSTVEKALEYQAKPENVDSEIEVHILDDENDTGPAYPIWRVIFSARGDALKVESWHREPEPFETQLHKPGAWRVPPKGQRTGGWAIRVEWPDSDVCVNNIYAPDEQAAIKIGAEARFKFLALERKP